MSRLHVHGLVTPTSKVVRKRTEKSPLDGISLKKRQPRPSSRPQVDYESQIVDRQLPVTADFRGLDILSAMDYLKRLQSDLPPRLSREKRTELLNRRRNMPDIVLAHQIASLFPNMANLEKETHWLVSERRIVALPLQDGDVAYIRPEDLKAPEELFQMPLSALKDDKFRQYSQAGFLMRRNGQLVLSAPNIGAYFSNLASARKWVLAHLRKSIMLEKDLRSRYELWRDGGVFQFEALMHDLVGSSRVEILRLTVGRAAKITKRGREER